MGTRRPRKTLVVNIETGHGGAVPRTLVGLAIDARTRALAEESEIDEF